MPRRPGFRLLIQGEWACFRRPEFTADFVTYDAIPPLHLRRLLERCLADANDWAICRITVLAPIACEWLEVVVATGTRRALALRRPRYIVDLELRAGRPTRQHADLLPGMTIHLGLSDHPANVRIVDRGDALHAFDDTRDLGWMPVALGTNSPRSTIYQRLSLTSGIVDLTRQDETMRAR